MAPERSTAPIALRRDDSTLILRWKWETCCFMYPLSSTINLSRLQDEVRRRFKFRRDDVFRFTYCTPGSACCLLESEQDLHMLILGAMIYQLKVVDITVIKQKEQGDTNVVEIELEEEGHLGKAYRTEQPKTLLSDEWAHVIRFVGQKFNQGIDEFRENLKKYAAFHGFDYKFLRNNGKRIHAYCSDFVSLDGSHFCNWFVKGSVISPSGVFVIRDKDLLHTCLNVGRKLSHSKLDSEVIMNYIDKDVMYNSALRPKDIQMKIKDSYGFDILYKVALKAKEKAKNKMYGHEADSFNKLSWYKDVVMETNNDSIFELEIDPATNRFQRVFLAYGACVDGFQHALPVLYVDGIFGKSVYKGQILAATGRNGNEGMFPVAMCVCSSETQDNWLFFFSNLKKLIARHGRTITFISDRGHGLLSAFDRVFPGNPHLFCYKHLQMNLMKRFQALGKSVCIASVRDCFWKVAYSSSEREYRFNLNALRKVGGEKTIDAFLLDLPVENWCRAFFVGDRYGIMANGMAESFNNWISVERHMPVYCMLDLTRIKIMDMISSRQREATTWITRLTPSMQEKLTQGIKAASCYTVHCSEPGVFLVKSEFAYTVRLHDRTCSCFKWQINCFPCCHALAAIGNHPGADVYDFINPYFHTDTYRKSDSFPICSISNLDQEIALKESNSIFPPVVKRPPGRRRTKRFKSSGEFTKKTIICGRCGVSGHHNKLTCTEVLL